MDYTNDKGERRYFSSPDAVEAELVSKGFNQDHRNDCFYRQEGDGWVIADIRYNNRGYFIRITVELEA